MFTQTWKKYLPVIAILLKKSVNGEQRLSMNYTDFQRAAGGRKIKFTFSNLRINNGRIETNSKHSPFAKEFLQVLQEDVVMKSLISKQKLEFALSGDFQLLIINNTANDIIEEEVSEVQSAG